MSIYSLCGEEQICETLYIELEEMKNHLLMLGSMAAAGCGFAGGTEEASDVLKPLLPCTVVFCLKERKWEMVHQPATLK